MAFLGDPRSWISYMNSKDCSSSEWCDIHKLYPPPSTPPPHSSPKFSPLIIAMAGILASAFILASYYYNCRRVNSNDDDNDESIHETATDIGSNLLEENNALEWMAVWKYKRGNDRSDSCCVCLSEFEEGESVRVLPNCTHAFHPPCIETWLKSQSTCPLCRRASVPVVPAYTVVIDLPLHAGTTSDTETTNEEEAAEETIHNNGDVQAPPPLPALMWHSLSDLGRHNNNNSLHRIIDIIDDQSINKIIGKSVSMDHHPLSSPLSSSKYRARGDQSSNKYGSYKRKQLLHSVFRGPISMKRSFSSRARFSLTTTTHTPRHPVIIIPPL
ncbi:hypothetical protein PIB30_011069 [Stylosanthes scabra]|uniref:RING-type E3 ubiquitin transferase n=1 Tax=Stylosanthes scabra TaxID=79078 RepID=A0ABU6X334_9FABA|nr:hypothetical protein [Stylosanthes scabra]